MLDFELLKMSSKTKKWLFDACFYLGKYLEFSLLGKEIYGSVGIDNIFSQVRDAEKAISFYCAVPILTAFVNYFLIEFLGLFV